MSEEKDTKFKKGVTNGRSGKTIEEIFGSEKAKKLREKLRSSHQGQKNPCKGKTLEEIHGEERGKQLRKENKQKQIETHNTPEYLEKARDIMNDLVKDRVFRKKLGIGSKKWHRENREYWLSIVAPKLWAAAQTPEVLEKMRKIKRTSGQREKSRQGRLSQSMPVQATSIELSFRKALINKGIQFEINKTILNKTQPDIFIAPNICIYLDGCYWHKCYTCIDWDRMKQGPCAKSINRQYYVDKYFNKLLTDCNYIVLRFWEHEINSGINSCIEKVIEYVKV